LGTKHSSLGAARTAETGWLGAITASMKKFVADSCSRGMLGMLGAQGAAQARVLVSTARAGARVPQKHVVTTNDHTYGIPAAC
jgi:hypothetical protein